MRHVIDMSCSRRPKGYIDRCAETHSGMLFPRSLGVSDFGGVLGLSIFKSNGIGKSTPVTSASPGPRAGRYANDECEADEQAASTTFLS